MYDSKSQVKKRKKTALVGKSNAHTVDRFKTSVAKVKPKKKKNTYYADGSKGPLSKQES